MAAEKAFDLHENIYYQNSRFDIMDLECKKEFWNVDETISELSYLTHDYFRYYGKFPSKVGKMILEDLLGGGVIDREHDFIIDNYAGSGTTLVEAKLAGVDSIGLDINPFAALACRVKTYNYNVTELRNIWGNIKNEIFKCTLSDEVCRPEGDNNADRAKKERINRAVSGMQQNAEFTKWFSDQALFQLAVIKDTLLELEYSRNREFFDLGFFAIIRRVSYAHDGEVRPHVNKNKRKRDAIEAFSKKITEMLDTMEEWNAASDSSVYSNAFLVSNADAENVNEIIETEKRRKGRQLGAIVSHPPYLNCFDYIPVYKLKFMWAEGFEEIFGRMTYKEIKASEIKSYPVKSHNDIERYFLHNYAAYRNAYYNLKENGYCCIVIGDCTVRKELFSVHKAFIAMMKELGFFLEKIAYRSTAYGIGQYAYNFRADYSEEKDGKQDAILFFRKVYPADIH